MVSKMEKSNLDSMPTPVIVISEHQDRTSTSSSGSWNSSPALPASPPQDQAEPQHDIESVKLELPPPLPPRHSPNPDTKPHVQRNVRFAEEQLPPPIPSRSILRTAPHEPLNNVKFSGALPVPNSEPDATRNNTRAETLGRDIGTVSLVRAHLPQSFYTPSPNTGEIKIEIRSVADSYYAPVREIVRGHDAPPGDVGAERAISAQTDGGRCADDGSVVPANGREATRDGDHRANEVAGDCEFVGSRQESVAGNRSRGLSGDCEFINPSQTNSEREEKRYCGWVWTKTRIIIMLRILNCLFACTMTPFALYISFFELALAGLCIVRTILSPSLDYYDCSTTNTNQNPVPGRPSIPLQLLSPHHTLLQAPPPHFPRPHFETIPPPSGLIGLLVCHRPHDIGHAKYHPDRCEATR